MVINSKKCGYYCAPLIFSGYFCCHRGSSVRYGLFDLQISGSCLDLAESVPQISEISKIRGVKRRYYWAPLISRDQIYWKSGQNKRCKSQILMHTSYILHIFRSGYKFKKCGCYCAPLIFSGHFCCHRGSSVRYGLFDLQIYGSGLDLAESVLQMDPQNKQIKRWKTQILLRTSYFSRPNLLKKWSK